MALLLEKGVEGLCNRVMEVGVCVLYGLGRWWQSRKQNMGRLLLNIGPPLSCYLSSYFNSFTVYSS